jgi:hypothetical protein
MKVDVLFQDINVSLHNPTKKAWRKSLRHAPIKESLIVKIEISDSNSYSGTNLFLVLCILSLRWQQQLDERLDQLRPSECEVLE